MTPSETLVVSEGTIATDSELALIQALAGATGFRPHGSRPFPGPPPGATVG